MTLQSPPEAATEIESLVRRGPDTAWIRQGRATLGWGNARRFEIGGGSDRYRVAREVLADTGAPIAFASFTFDPDVGGSVVVVPDQVVIVDGADIRMAIGDMADLPQMVPSPENGRKLELSTSGIEMWRGPFESALDLIDRQRLDKVVLSRTARVESSSDLSTTTILGRLARSQPNSHTFLVDGLIGASPELLAGLEGDTARSVAVAGTADATNPDADDQLATPKMTREHEYSVASVKRALRKHISGIEHGEPISVDHDGIRHLTTPFQGTVQPGTTVLDIIASLHPTAAVAGAPPEAALEWIRKLETHQRGRYAGPVGWFDRNGQGEFAIALRCALIKGRQATLYAGAGLVRGSDPVAEFEETNMKLRPMLGALGAL